MNNNGGVPLLRWQMLAIILPNQHSLGKEENENSCSHYYLVFYTSLPPEKETKEVL